MTEEQAKGKWCPFARQHSHRDVLASGKPLNTALAGLNRNENDQPLGACIASACMAWRWEGYTRTDQKHHGHCGLAGPVAT